MKKRRFFILFLCALLLQGMHSANAENIMDTPEWVTGTLLISLAGSETIVDPAKVPVDQYVCAFDFENRRINSVRVPYHSRLMDDSYPLVVYSEMPGKNSLTFDHHAYTLARISSSGNGNSPELQIADCFVSQRHPISVLDARIGNDTTELYYLCQGVSESGQAEYQLVGEGDDLTVYRHFSSDCFLSRITASVSPDGKIAWQEYGSDLYVSDGNTQMRLLDDALRTDAICWLDDNSLLYTAEVTDPDAFRMTHQAEFVLRLWHTDTNTIEEMNERWSDHAVVLPFTLSEMTLSQDGRFLAAYLAAPYGETEFGDSIIIISLEDGKSWFYDPWNKCEPLADARGSICYFTDDTGTILYYPSETLKPQLAWMPER